MRKVVVTGATSMLGIATVVACLKHGIQVVALVRKKSKKKRQLPASKHLVLVPCNLEQMASYIPMTKDADVFYHFAWQGTKNNDERSDFDRQEANIRYTLDAVRLAKRFGCRKFIGAGSQAEYGVSDEALTRDTPIRPTTAYGIAKFAGGQMASQLCQQLDMKCIWGRVLSVFGPHDNEKSLINYVLKSFLMGKPPQLTRCEQIWDYLYEDDAGKAFFDLGLSRKATGIYVIGSGDGRPLRQFVEEIQTLVEAKTAPMFGAESYTEGQVMHLEADISLMTRDTGWQPRVSFLEGIKTILQSMSWKPQYEE